MFEAVLLLGRGKRKSHSKQPRIKGGIERLSFDLQRDVRRE